MSNESNEVKEYKELIEYEIGEFFTTGKDTYKVVPDNEESCFECDFDADLCVNALCVNLDRSINQNDVHFILYDSEE